MEKADPVSLRQVAKVFKRLGEASYRNALDHGFHSDVVHNHGESIALMHSELSEALEAIRHGNPPDQHLPQFDSLTVEMADLLIRVFDYSVRFCPRLAEALLAKMTFNGSRPYKHGKEF